MTALDRILPEPTLVERHHVDVAAPAARVRQHARHLDPARMPWVRMLFALRTLPDRFTGRDAYCTGVPTTWCLRAPRPASRYSPMILPTK
jgi:hypothetical protein